LINLLNMHMWCTCWALRSTGNPLANNKNIYSYS